MSNPVHLGSIPPASTSREAARGTAAPGRGPVGRARSSPRTGRRPQNGEIAGRFGPRRPDRAAAVPAGAPSPSPTAAPPPAGSLFHHPVRFERVDGSLDTAERGLLFVPQNRSRPESGVLAVELDEPGYYAEEVAPLLPFADVVGVGQRGIGTSPPDTRCEGARGPIFDRTAPRSERARRLSDAAERCRRFWNSAGFDLQGLTVVEAAHDVAAVARALGYERISLKGVSFGSHWAMAVLRHHPELVERALLGGLEGPDHTWDRPGAVLDGLRRVADDAAPAPELEPWIPRDGIVGALERTVEQLERGPVRVSLPRADSAGTRTVTVTADLVRMPADEGYSEVPDSAHELAAWPADVLRLAAGRYEGIARWAPTPGNAWSRIPAAAYFMLDCSSGITPGAAATRRRRPGGPHPGPHRLVIVERGTHGALAEAMDADPGVRDAVLEFLDTGSLEGVPERVVLPAPDWVVPAELPAAP